MRKDHGVCSENRGPNAVSCLLLLFKSYSSAPAWPGGRGPGYPPKLQPLTSGARTGGGGLVPSCLPWPLTVRVLTHQRLVWDARQQLRDLSLCCSPGRGAPASPPHPSTFQNRTFVSCDVQGCWMSGERDRKCVCLTLSEVGSPRVSSDLSSVYGKALYPVLHALQRAPVLGSQAGGL